jgi:hypothetical protein
MATISMINTADPKVISAIASTENTRPGDLAHALRECNKLIFKSSKYCRTQQITGYLRSLPLSHIKSIEIICVPVYRRDLTNTNIDNVENTDLADCLNDYSATFDNGNFHFKHAGYNWIIHISRNNYEVAVTQLIRTGSKLFRNWITNEIRDSGALPWAWYFLNNRLYTNTNTLIEADDESALFSVLQYKYIPLSERYQGNVNIWNTYKINS